MSPTIWTRCGGRRSCGPWAGSPWRIVEGQHLVSTRKLVDSDAEQAELEALLESAKPRVPRHAAERELHYLLFTPFRHPPLRHGSRFGGRHEPSLWYGSEELRTAMAEVAYYRFVLIAHSPALRMPLVLELSAFQAEVRSEVAADLTAPPFAEFRSALTSTADYAATQALGAEMRADGVEVIRYASARWPEGTNVGLFTARAFAKNEPTVPHTWHCVADRERIEFRRKDYFSRESHAFERDGFLVDGSLPRPAA
jgi:RES domain